MRLVYTHDVPRIGLVRTFRHSRIGPILGLIVIAGMTALWTFAAALADGARWYHWLPVALGVLMVLATAGFVRKAFQSANWLMTIAQDGVYIKFRSYLNGHYKEDTPIVLHVPFAEIATAGSYRRLLSVPTTDGGASITWLTCLEIELKAPLVTGLVDAIRAERALRPVTNRAAKFHDYALRIVGPRTLQLRWNVSPGLKRAIETLRAFVPVREARVGSPVVWHEADEATRDAVILEMAEFGEKLTAQKLAADRFGFDSRDAGRYVEELMGIPPR